MFDDRQLVLLNIAARRIQLNAFLHWQLRSEGEVE